MSSLTHPSLTVYHSRGPPRPHPLLDPSSRESLGNRGLQDPSDPRPRTLGTPRSLVPSRYGGRFPAFLRSRQTSEDHTRTCVLVGTCYTLSHSYRYSYFEINTYRFN